MSYQSPFASTLLDTSLFANRVESQPCNDNKDAEQTNGFDLMRDFFAAPVYVVDNDVQKPTEPEGELRF